MRHALHTSASNCFAGPQQRTFGTITFTTRLRVSDEKSRASLVHTRAETSVAACEKCFVHKCPRIPFAICLGRAVRERQPSVCVRDPPVGADVGASVPCLRCLSFTAAVALAVVKHAIAVAAAHNIAVRDLNLIVRNELDGTPHQHFPLVAVCVKATFLPPGRNANQGRLEEHWGSRSGRKAASITTQKGMRVHQQSGTQRWPWPCMLAFVTVLARFSARFFSRLKMTQTHACEILRT
jgi:hypothetical protein